MIADPHATDLRCIYPMDADTDDWDDAGCGPVRVDANFGSNAIVASKPTSRAEEAAMAQAIFYVTTPETGSRMIALLKFLARRNAEMCGASRCCDSMSPSLRRAGRCLSAMMT